MDYQSAGTVAVANATRTANVIKWDSPNWGGFQVSAAYSTSPLAASSEGDMGFAPSGDGAGFNALAQFTGSNWQIGASIWEAESEAVNTAATSTTATNYVNARLEQSSQSVWGYIRFGGFKIGAGMNMAELTSGGTVTSDRTSYTLPASFTTGPHNFYAHYTIAEDDDATTADDSATMMAVAYVYDLSKRTSVGITYAMIENETAGRYNFFTGTSLGSSDAAVLAGEDPTIIQFTLRHAF
jgi:predicted porin